MKDLISIILPVYNGEKTIGRCIESILVNTTECGDYRFDFELLVVDDGSADKTWQILQEYNKKNKQVRIFHQSNKGCPGARNTGLNNVEGNYITFCDADDWVEADWLMSMYITIKVMDADFVKYRAIIEGMNVSFNPKEIKIWNQYNAKLAFLKHQELNGILWSCLFKKECFDNISFDMSLTTYDDSDVMWKVLQQIQKVVRVNDARYHYIIDGDSLSNGRMNLFKVTSAILLWDRIYDSIPESEILLKKQAYITRLLWYFSSLKGMFRSNIKNRILEKQIQMVIRQSMRDSLHSQNSLFNKLSIIVSMINLRIARFLYCFFIHS